MIDFDQSHDDGGGHRPPGASQRDLGVESAKLSAGDLEAADEQLRRTYLLFNRQSILRFSLPPE